MFVVACCVQTAVATILSREGKYSEAEAMLRDTFEQALIAGAKTRERGLEGVRHTRQTHTNTHARAHIDTHIHTTAGTSVLKDSPLTIKPRTAQ